jgi:hypothetical protein
MYLSDRPVHHLNNYVADYLKEELVAEGLVRKLPVYSEFLAVAALSDTELFNFSTIGRDCGVSSHTIQAYFQILENTMLGRRLPGHTKRENRQASIAESPGVRNSHGDRPGLRPDTSLVTVRNKSGSSAASGKSD